MTAGCAAGAVPDCFDVFGYRFALACDSLAAATLFRRLYAAFHVEHTNDPLPLYRFGRVNSASGRVWQAACDGTVVATHPSFQQALQELEYAICSRVIAQRGALLVLHGATVCTLSGAAFFSGCSEAGKSTLSLALAARGYPLGGDDVAFLDPATGLLHPLPRCAHLDERARRLLRAAGLRISDPLSRRHGFITPADLGGSRCDPAPARQILLLSRGTGPRPTISAIAQAEATVFLLREAGWENRPTPDALAAIARLVGSATCWRVTSGRLRPTVEAVAELIGPPPTR